jgi:hypothetical protein
MSHVFRFFSAVAATGLAWLTGCIRMNEKDYQALVRDSNDYLKTQIERCKADFQIGSYSRYDWDQQKGELVWSDDGIPKVIAKVQFVGSISTKSNTWLWSWANPTIIDPVKQEIRKVKAFGERKGIERLISAKWTADETDGWEMTALAARLLEARGAYRSPDSDGFTFMIITDINWANP